MTETRPEPSLFAQLGARWRLGLRWKIVGLTGLSLIALVLVLSGAFMIRARTVMLTDQRARAKASAQNLAKNLAYNLSTDDVVSLQTSIEGIVQDSPDLAYVIVRQPGGSVIADAKASSLKDVKVELATRVVEAAVERDDQLASIPTYQVALPVVQWYGNGKVLGSVELAVRLDRVSQQIAAIIRQAIAIAALVLVAAVVAAYLLARMMANPLEQLTAAAAGMAAGDLRQDVQASGRDEIAALAGSFQSMAGGLRGMVSGLGEVARQLEQEGREIVGTVARQSTMATQQAAAISETSTTVAEIAQTSKAATEHADRVIEVAHRSEELSLQGKTMVEQVIAAMVGLGDQVKATAAAMGQLSQRAQQIGEVVATVKELAEQSNLLALNAAIEASRAGEHGRGFSVVALEMRNLAEQSKAAAGRVRNMLGEVQKWTQEAVQATGEGEKQARASIDLAHTAGQSIEGLAEAIRESSLAAKQIAANTRQQTVGVEQIVCAIEQVSTAMSETVVGTKQIERGTESLSALSSRLLEAVQRYQV